MSEAAKSCYPDNVSMLSVSEARAALCDRACVVPGTEQLGLLDAVGRILAEDVDSRINVPDFDNSAMDGYVLNTRDLATANADGLPVSQRIPAGTFGTVLEPGTCARIFTGAPIPEGSNAVVMQERTRQQGDQVIVEGAVKEWDNIRPRGNDIAAGDRVVRKGTRLDAAQLGLLASIGVPTVKVFRKLRAGIFSTGDELIEPGQPLQPGQIHNSNRYQMNALLTELGCDIVDLGAVPDSLEASQQALLDAAAKTDVVITTGGVSVGEEDHMRVALESVGHLDLWRIRMKPGKPLAFGFIGDTPFLGLPGNPVSAFVTFTLFAKPFLQHSQGRLVPAPTLFPVRAAFDYQAKGRREYVRVKIITQQGEPVAEAFPRQGSDVLSSVAWANGLVEVSENQTIKQGDTVQYLPLGEH